MKDTDFRELGRQLLTEFGSMHQRISRFADKALSGEMAVMRALMLAGGSLTPSELAIVPGSRAPASPISCALSKPKAGSSASTQRPTVVAYTSR